jgi:RimJ/RimL family protein N-acetyltransferase
MNGQVTTKINLAPFYYAHICLTPISEDCLKETIEWRNFYKEWFNHDREIIWDKHLLWFYRYQQLNNDFVFIVKNQQQRKVGQTALYNIDWDRHSGEFGRIVVNPEFAAQGYMKEACMATLHLAVTVFKLKSVYLQVKSNNTRAIELYKKCGFTLGQSLDRENFTMVFQA